MKYERYSRTSNRRANKQDRRSRPGETRRTSGESRDKKISFATWLGRLCINNLYTPRVE